MQINETGPIFYPTHKNKVKWNKALNIKPEIINLIEENSGKNPLNIGLSMTFFFLFWL